MLERRRAVLLTSHYREQEGLSVNEIARRLGRTPATVRAYIYDPDGSKARRVKDGYRGVCGSCGAQTTGEGPDRPRPLCAQCNGRQTAKWEKSLIEAALRAWAAKHGRPGRSTDLSLSYATMQAKRDGGVRLRRLQAGWEQGRWPAPSVVQYHFGTVKAANRAALQAPTGPRTDGSEERAVRSRTRVMVHERADGYRELFGERGTGQDIACDDELDDRSPARLLREGDPGGIGPEIIAAERRFSSEDEWLRRHPAGGDADFSGPHPRCSARPAETRLMSDFAPERFR